MWRDINLQVLRTGLVRKRNPLMGKRLSIPVGKLLLAGLMAMAIALFVQIPDARAEYGDIVINNYSDAAGMRPAVFPHWFHRIRFRCKVCHADLGFKFQAGGNEINMVKIIDGQFCGSCHNGEIAWSVQDCNLCHSGKPGTKTQVHESTTQKLAQPKSK
jgi:c(7)-type cytochrome triheme protein